MRMRAGWAAGLVVAAMIATACVPPWGEECAPSCTLQAHARRARVQVGLFPEDFGPESRAAIARESNMIVNHAFSWRIMEPRPGQFNFGPADDVDAFARRHGLTQYGFHFAWDNELLDDFPDWVATITDPDELRAVIQRRAEVIFDRYPHLAGIDVINEPLASFGPERVENHFSRVLGPDYIAQLFAIVEAEAPRSTRLFVNENFIEYRPAKADALVDLVAELIAGGARVDAVGLQTHLLLGEPDWVVYRQTMDRLALLGVTVMVTELDVPVGANVVNRRAVQAERYRRVVETCLAVLACDTVNIWGVDDGHTWLDGILGPGTDPLLYDDAYAPKPAYFAVRDAFESGRPHS